jgi:hypothetical protein
MKKPTTKNIAASVRQRLLNKAHETERPFSELLQCFAMERFLYRLSKSKYADKFVLKRSQASKDNGSHAPVAWSASQFRAIFTLQDSKRYRSRRRPWVNLSAFVMKDH